MKSRTAKTKGVNERVLREGSRFLHGDASRASRHAAPTPDGVRKYLDALLCPFCGKGPYKAPLMHIAKIHGLSHQEVREMAGVSMSASFTDPDTHARNVRNGYRSGGPGTDAIAKAVAQRKIQGRRQTAALTSSGKESIRRAKSVRDAQLAQERADIANQWNSSDKTWADVGRIAVAYGVTPHRMAQRMRRAGLNCPDGRVETTNRPTPRPKRHHCDVDGCEREHIAKGLCSYHYYKMREASGLAPECTEAGCIKPRVARGLCAAHYYLVKKGETDAQG